MKNLNLIACILFTAYSLTACDTLPTTSTPPPAAEPVVRLPPASSDKIKQANALYQQGKKRQAAHAYFAAGKDTSSPERERLMLQAVEVAAMIPDEALMQQFFAGIKTSRLDSNNKARYNYGKALLALIKNQPDIALDILPKEVSHLSPGLANKILLTRLRAADKTNNHFKIAEERVRQHAYLKNDKNRANNRKQIWQHLNKLSSSNINEQRKKANNHVFRGWLDLVYLNKLNSDDATLNNNLMNWRKNFSNHPAEPFSYSIAKNQGQTTATTTESSLPTSSSVGKSIAVLLPFNGRFANVGNDLYRGIADAHKKHSPNTQIRKYDTSQLDATVVYNQALQQGAGFILGPFSKENITSMARNGYLQKPALSLNYLPPTLKHPSNLYQIGLLPEDETLQVATLATHKGQKRALVMVPDSQWGRRLEKAFSAAYRSREGEIAKVVYYPNRATNYSHNVAELLSAASSADMIFLAASPTQARLIYPAIMRSLARSSAEKNPVVYATSHIYSGRPSPSLNNNLNGIIYTEIPSILASNESPAQQYPRLYALGQDAFIISQSLADLKQGTAISGKTGKISYSSDGRFHRILEWATFQKGVPVSYVP